jgi:hypothetical protein
MIIMFQVEDDIKILKSTDVLIKRLCQQVVGGIFFTRFFEWREEVVERNF